jgi:hypothetical protein
VQIHYPISGAPGGTRTHNLLIRSQALYPLSYGGMSLRLYPEQGAGSDRLWGIPYERQAVSGQLSAVRRKQEDGS